MDNEPNGIAERVDPRREPRIEIVRRASSDTRRLGVFASSFNPPTAAHVELVRLACARFALDEVLALAGDANADKAQYECSLEHRFAMLALAFEDAPHVSLGVSSHPFYVDMVEALARQYPPQTDLHFIVGFDTFERVLDFDDRYTARYHRHFGSRVEALRYLFERSSMIVASRAGAGMDRLLALVESEPAVPRERVSYLDFPPDLGELSASEVRNRRRTGAAIAGLAPAAVEKYIEELGLYA